jgi:glycerophosphoryl diester phosphodiesterase
LVQLLNVNALLDAASLAAIAGYAQAIGVPKSLLVSEGPQGALAATTLASDAHAAGVAVHVWTFRAENAFLPVALRRGTAPQEHGDISAEMKLHLSAGADGLFCDQPDIARVMIDDAVSGV